MKKNVKGLVVLGVFLILLVFSSQAGDIIPTPLWVDFSGNATFNDQSAALGTIIDAYDPQGVLCGTFTVGSVTLNKGVFGFMPVYGDDKSAPDTLDEGADQEDTIQFRIMKRNASVASGDPVWHNSGEQNTVNIYTYGVVGLVITDSPPDTTGAENDTVRFMIGIHNTGDGLDLYGVNGTSARGWEIIDYGMLTFYGTDSAVYNYNEMDSIIYVYFDVIIPASPGDVPDTLDFEVFSRMDTTVSVQGSVTLTASLSDIGDLIDNRLPTAFNLYQNYPNPFNPTTTVAFNLPLKSTVQLQVYDILGQLVDAVDLGVLSSGDHSVMYDASELASGIYLYRLVTEYGKQSRKMILLK